MVVARCPEGKKSMSVACTVLNLAGGDGAGDYGINEFSTGAFGACESGFQWGL